MRKMKKKTKPPTLVVDGTRKFKAMMYTEITRNDPKKMADKGQEIFWPKGRRQWWWRGKISASNC